MGLERLVALLQQGEQGAVRAPHAYLVMAGEGAEAAGLALAERLRDRVPGLRLLSNAGSGSFKSQFKRADRSGAELALVLGENEIARGEVTVKPLRDERPQETVAKDNIGPWLERWLADRAAAKAGD